MIMQSWVSDLSRAREMDFVQDLTSSADGLSVSRSRPWSPIMEPWGPRKTASISLFLSIKTWNLERQSLIYWWTTLFGLPHSCMCKSVSFKFLNFLNRFFFFSQMPISRPNASVTRLIDYSDFTFPRMPIFTVKCLRRHTFGRLPKAISLLYFT